MDVKKIVREAFPENVIVVSPEAPELSEEHPPLGYFEIDATKAKKEELTKYARYLSEYPHLVYVKNFSTTYPEMAKIAYDLLCGKLGLFARLAEGSQVVIHSRGPIPMFMIERAFVISR